MPRPKGRPLPADHRDRIRRASARNSAWLEASRPILNAANQGDYVQASELLFDYMDQRHSEVLNSTTVANASQAEIRAMIADMGRELDELQAETERAWEARDAAQVVQVQAVLLAGLHIMNRIRKGTE